MVDVRKIRLFVAVYEAGSITRAAEREHIAQPALTVHVQQMEEELNVKLFERSAHGVNPTPAGRHFYAICQDLLRRLESVGEEMQAFGGEVAGFATDRWRRCWRAIPQPIPMLRCASWRG